MRFVCFHCERFASEVTQKGRSPVREDPGGGRIDVGNCLLVLLAVEKTDEKAPGEVVRRASLEISRIAKNVGTETVVLHSFAHLFAELADANVAVEVLGELKTALGQSGFEAKATPFGWFNTLELKAKGHPYSRVARRIEVDP